MIDNDPCQCRRCLRERKEGTAIGGLFWPAEATRMIVCPVCGDKRCVHALDHDAPSAKAELYAHNAWVERHFLLPADAAHQSPVALVASRVDAALGTRYRCELGSSATGKPLVGQERRDALTALFGEIVNAMGVERFAEIPVELLDQFSVMSVVKNHDTAGLLRSLVNSFMIAYSVPETSDRAYQALLEVEALRAEVGRVRQRARVAPGSPSDSMQ